VKPSGALTLCPMTSGTGTGGTDVSDGAASGAPAGHPATLSGAAVVATGPGQRRFAAHAGRGQPGRPDLAGVPPAAASRRRSPKVL